MFGHGRKPNEVRDRRKWRKGKRCTELRAGSMGRRGEGSLGERRDENTGD